MKKEEAVHELTWEVVLKRLDYLEREHARWRQANFCWRLLRVAAVSMLGLIVLLGAAVAKDGGVVEEVRAKRIVVVDAANRPRLELGSRGVGFGIVLKDKEERVRTELLLDEYPWLRFLSEDGQTNVWLVGPASLPSLGFYDMGGHRRAVIGKQGLYLWDETGAIRVEIEGESQGGQGSTASVVVRDKAGGVIWRAP